MASITVLIFSVVVCGTDIKATVIGKGVHYRINAIGHAEMSSLISVINRFQKSAQNSVEDIQAISSPDGSA
jgi:hypothetical protein